MIKSIYLHIGLSKTGTSSLQTFLYKNSDALLKDFKILYPKSVIGMGPAHYVMAFSLKPPPESPMLKTKKTFYEYMDDLKQEIDNKKAERIIISSEAFMHINDNINLKKLYNALKEIANKLNIIVYFRRQDLWLESSYIQVVKAYNTRNSNSFKSSIKHAINHLEWLLNYDKFLQNWAEAFPDAELVPRIYDRKNFPSEDIVLDFFSILEIVLDKKYIKNRLSENPSLSVVSTLALRKINEHFRLSLEEHKDLLNYLFTLDKELEFPKKVFFSLSDRLSFLEHYRKSNEEFFRRFFKSENKFTLSEEEIIFYKEQDKISEKEVNRTVEHIYNKSLSYLKRKGVMLIPLSVNDQGFNRVFGWIDDINENFVAGWVVNTNISEPSEVEVLIDGYSLVSTKCQKFREDIKHIYGIDYNTHFHINWKDISYTKEFLEYLFSKPLDAELNVLVREKASGYVIEGNYEPIYVKDLLEKISQNGIALTKKIKGINGIFVKGFILQTKKKLRACVSEQAKVTLIKNGQGLTEVFIYTENKENKVIPLELIYEDGSSEHVELSISV